MNPAYKLTRFVCSVVLASVFNLPATASPKPQFGPPMHKPPSPEDQFKIDAEKKARKEANKDRQKRLQRDTEQLLKLATELKQRVDKSSEYTLSLDVIHKAEQIEKLAKSVREKMKADDYMPGPTDPKMQ